MAFEVQDLGVEGGAALVRALNKHIRRAQLPPRFDPVLDAARSGFNLSCLLASDAALGVTASKWGGSPDLPASVQVPSHLSFIAQVNLSRLPTRAAAVAGLPTGGVLSFFYDLATEPSLYDTDRTTARGLVTYSPATASFARRHLPGVHVLPACELRATSAVHLPDAESSDTMCGLGIELRGGQYAPNDTDATMNERLRYRRLLEAHDGGHDAPRHRLAGHPIAVQGNLQLEAEAYARGGNPGSPAGFEALDTEALSASRRFRLLLQVDAGDDIDWSWGDDGRLYFLIDELDLRAKEFERALVHWQSH
jgi:hypothetical protein